MRTNAYMNLAVMDDDDRRDLAFKKYVMQYQEELSDNDREYYITLDTFKRYLTKRELWDIFQAQLEYIWKGLITLEYVAIDYEIPVIMVKYFLNMFNMC